MEEITKQLKEAANKQFTSVEFRNGHFHTVKAYDSWNVYMNSDKTGIENQIDYIRFVEDNENTDVYDLLTADDEKEAMELEIVDGDGGFI
jgi:hypothetical protein